MAFSHDPASVLFCHRSQSPQQTENNGPVRIVSSSVTSKRGFRYHGGRTMNPDPTLGTSGIWIRFSQYTKQNSTIMSSAVVKYSPATSFPRSAPSRRAFQELLMGTPAAAAPRD